MPILYKNTITESTHSICNSYQYTHVQFLQFSAPMSTIPKKENKGTGLAEKRKNKRNKGRNQTKNARKKRHRYLPPIPQKTYTITTNPSKKPTHSEETGFKRWKPLEVSKYNCG